MRGRRARDLEERIHGVSQIRRVEYLLMEVHVLLDKQEFELARRIYGNIVLMLTSIVDVDGYLHCAHPAARRVFAACQR